MFILYFILVIGLILIFLTLVFSVLSIAPWLPAKSKDLGRINKLANLQPGQKLYELGCGDGRVSIFLAKNNPQATVIGIEVSLLFYFLAKARAKITGLKNLQIVLANALKTDLREADVIYVFGVRHSMNQLLKQKFQQELKIGAKVLSYVFAINDWPGRVVQDKPSDDSIMIYVYER